MKYNGVLVPESQPQQQRDVRLLRSDFLEMVAEWQRRCGGDGVPILMYETYRSPERQAWIYASGRSREGVILTGALPMQSAHQHGVAVDAVPWTFEAEQHRLHKALDWTPFQSSDDRRMWERFPAKRDLAMLDPAWRVMEKHATAIGIEWSGHWTRSWEYVHWQLPRRRWGNAIDGA